MDENSGTGGRAVPDPHLPGASRVVETLTRAHARSGDRTVIAAYLGGGDVFDRALERFAENNADRNERDHQGLLEAVDDGWVTVTAT